MTSLKSKIGIHAETPPIKVLIPRDLHIGNEEFDSIAIGDRVKIEIKRSRFQVNDPHILSIGQFLGRVGSAATTVQPAAIFMEESASASAATGEAEAEEAAEEEEGEEGGEGEE
jgi:hypothetical protein